jgi:hypothetical protein
MEESMSDDWEDNGKQSSRRNVLIKAYLPVQGPAIEPGGF